ncbi:MAG TPA: hypothetical protein VGV89_05165 [Thermoplasmata archaeon]|nr:hypothetical protein [Thermoplasmata archaeon]
MEGAGSARGPSEVLLKDLRVSDESFLITARVVSVTRREVRRKSDGQRRPVLAGLLSDGTATVPFTWWDPPTEDIEPGTVLRAGPVRASIFRGRVELSFGWKTQVAPASVSELPDVPDVGMPTKKVAELRAGDEAFALEARVLEIEPKFVTVSSERREIREGLFGDGTGLIAFTAWVELPLVRGAAVRVTGAHVGSFRGRPQISLDERASVAPSDEGRLPGLEELLRDSPVELGRLEGSPGSERATIAGRAVAVQPPSGLVWRCPQCRRVLRGGSCRVHGVADGVPDLRMRVVVDDGTGTVTVNLERPQVESLTGRTLEQCLAQVRDRMDPAAIESQLFLELFGHRVIATGPIRRDDFGLGMYPKTVRRSGASTPTTGSGL